MSVADEILDVVVGVLDIGPVAQGGCQFGTWLEIEIARRLLVIPADAEIQDQFVVDCPVVLEVNAELLVLVLMLRGEAPGTSWPNSTRVGTVVLSSMS